MEHSDLNAARLFVEVVRQGSFTGAARTLRLPKSTVSRKVSELESRLGTRLLQRTTRKLSLTDLGVAYYERAERAVQDLREAEALVSHAQDAPRGTLRVTAPPDLGDALLSVWLPEFCREYSEVDVVVDLSARRVDLVEEGYDVALRAGPLSDSSLIVKTLFAGRFGLYASHAYLERRGRPDEPEQVKGHDCLVFGHVPETRWQLESATRQVILDVRGRVAIRDFGYLRRAAVQGGGIVLLPDVLTGRDVQEGRLQRVLPDYSCSASAISIVYPSREFLAPKTRVFIDFLVARFNEWRAICGSAQ